MKALLLAFVLASAAVATAQPAPPKFEDYKVPVYTGKIAKPVLKTQAERQFRTRLRDAADEDVNFAGHFILTTWGCGSECVTGAVLDAKTGKVYWLPFTICCWPWDVENPITFRADSKLIVFTGSRHEEGLEGTYYYEFEKGRFRLLHAVKLPPRGPLPPPAK